jgi:hypothetical protein
MSEPVYRCQATWDGEHCNGDGVEHFMISKLPFSLAGAQMKYQAKSFRICDDCWPKTKPFLMKSLGYDDDEVRKAAEEAGLTDAEVGL